jgi:hypothetical protein
MGMQELDAQRERRTLFQTIVEVSECVKFHLGATKHK